MNWKKHLNGSDKGGWHTYLPVYEQLLSHLEDRPIRLLEIGIRGGNSLALWDAVFHHPDARIFAVDIDPACRHKGIVDEINQRSPGRITTAIGDSTCVNVFPEVEFDVIVDDGCHEGVAQLRTYLRYAANLKAGGIYIIEDVFEPEVLASLRPLIIDRRIMNGSLRDECLAVLPGLKAVTRENFTPPLKRQTQWRPQRAGVSEEQWRITTEDRGIHYYIGGRNAPIAALATSIFHWRKEGYTGLISVSCAPDVPHWLYTALNAEEMTQARFFSAGEVVLGYRPWRDKMRHWANKMALHHAAPTRLNWSIDCDMLPLNGIGGQLEEVWREIETHGLVGFSAPRRMSDGMFLPMVQEKHPEVRSIPWVNAGSVGSSLSPGSSGPRARRQVEEWMGFSAQFAGQTRFADEWGLSAAMAVQGTQVSESYCRYNEFRNEGVSYPGPRLNHYCKGSYIKSEIWMQAWAATRRADFLGVATWLFR